MYLFHRIIIINYVTLRRRINIAMAENTLDILNGRAMPGHICRKVCPEHMRVQIKPSQPLVRFYDGVKHMPDTIITQPRIYPTLAAEVKEQRRFAVRDLPALRQILLQVYQCPRCEERRPLFAPLAVYDAFPGSDINIIKVKPYKLTYTLCYRASFLS